MIAGRCRMFHSNTFYILESGTHVLLYPFACHIFAPFDTGRIHPGNHACHAGGNVLAGQRRFRARARPCHHLRRRPAVFLSRRQVRHDVRPGITGWAQVNGRNTISWYEKFELDVYYVDNISLLLDLKIFWMTIMKVILREDINQGADRPMNPFTGNN